MSKQSTHFENVSKPSLYHQRFKSRAERFWEKVDRSGDCWLWKAYRDKDGYGAFCWNRNAIQAHRASLNLAGYELGPHDVVCHKCDNPACVKPDHLFIGDVQANHDDMVRKGRSLTGSKHHNSKVTEDDVRCIRRVHRQFTNVRLAEIFGIAPSTVSDIKARRSWVHV